VRCKEPCPARLAFSRSEGFSILNKVGRFGCFYSLCEEAIVHRNLAVKNRKLEIRPGSCRFSTVVGSHGVS
jgi:hypothetical protein